MDRREFLQTGGSALLTSAVAGCLDAFETQSAWADQPLVEDRPEAVYVPASIEEMGRYGTASDGEYGFALSFTFPHRFWTVTGTETNMADIQSDHSIHLMVSVWDAETRTVLPTDLSMELANEDGLVDERGLWPMLSQRMGFHYGDNVALPEDGEYTATVRASPVEARKYGAFEGRFEESATVEIGFAYRSDDVYDLAFEEIDEERRGDRGAIDLMNHGRGNGHDDDGDHDHDGHEHDHDGNPVPTSVAPSPDELPGRSLGTERSGDAEFVGTLLTDHRLADGDQWYLAVSPRTPYNGIVLPLMSLSASVSRDGETVEEYRLPEALDHELGYHYGTTVDPLDADDAITISTDSPPQASRHDGYETAFLSMPDVEFDVSSE